MRIISKPIPGLDWKKWDATDIEIWSDLIRKSGQPLTAKEVKEMARIRTKYNLNKFYLFE